MEKVDARKQTREELHQTRQTIVRLHQAGTPVMQIVQKTGLSWAMVNAAIKRYTAGGEAALKPAARGKKQGTGRTLTYEQEMEIVRLIRVRRPRYYRLKDALWDRDSVMQLIEQKYGIRLSLRGIGNYLRRWGLVLMKPQEQPYERCTKEIRQWLDVHYAEMQQQAKALDAEMYWLNKPAALSTDIWFLQAPSILGQDAIAANSAPKKPRMVSVVTNQGKVRWAIINGSFNATRQIGFLNSLIKDTRRKMLFLMRFDRTTYQSHEVRDWLSDNINKVRIFPAMQDGN